MSLAVDVASSARDDLSLASDVASSAKDDLSLASDVTSLAGDESSLAFFATSHAFLATSHAFLATSLALFAMSLVLFAISCALPDVQRGLDRTSVQYQASRVPAPLRPLANPPNPWASTAVEYLDGEAPSAGLEVYEDHTRGILAHNDSPDVGFSWSVNPYRGCFHACAYCYARPSHEYLSFGAGTDFERKIVIKKRARELLAEAFDDPKWQGDLVAFSGVTDCYQPLEASYRLTRGCLEVCAEYRNPVAIITKAPLVERDVDVLQELGRLARATVMVSVPFWNEANARAIEPFVTTPARRIRAIGRLAEAGIPVGVMIGPIIPGLNDEDIGPILRAARDAGARFAGSVLLRLPGPVKQVFEERLRAALPLRADRVLHRVRETRGGKLYDSRFGTRGTGEGPYAQAIAGLFEQTAQKLGLETRRFAGEAPPTTFRRPRGQLSLL
jgi:DNA repair photolyase